MNPYFESDAAPLWCGPNDGGIKRGDSSRTGDLEAGHTDTVGPNGSGVPRGTESGNPTATPDSLAEPVSRGVLTPDEIATSSGEIEDMYVTEDSAINLGLTNTPGHPPEDPIADEGPTQTPESIRQPKKKRSTHA
jgi:hypothetical protein